MEGSGVDEDCLWDTTSDALAHLVGRPPGEGEGQDTLRIRSSLLHQVRDPRDEHPGLARARSGEHEQRSTSVLDGPQLVGVEGQVKSGHVRLVSVFCCPT